MLQTTKSAVEARCFFLFGVLPRHTSSTPVKPAIPSPFSQSAVSIKLHVLRQRHKFLRRGFAICTPVSDVRNEISKSDPTMCPNVVMGQLPAIEKAREKWSWHVEENGSFLCAQFGVMRDDCHHIRHNYLFFTASGNPIESLLYAADRWRSTLKHLPIRYRRPYCARHSSVSGNLIRGKNPLYVSRQHGHSVETMWRTYLAWMDGAVESDIALIKASMERGSASDAPTPIGPADKAVNPSGQRSRSARSTSKFSRIFGLTRICQSIRQYAQGRVS